MPRAEARGGMARGDRGEARRAKSGGFGAVPLGFATDAPRGRAGASLLGPTGIRFVLHFLGAGTWFARGWAKKGGESS